MIIFKFIIIENKNIMILALTPFKWANKATHKILMIIGIFKIRDLKSFLKRLW